MVTDRPRIPAIPTVSRRGVVTVWHDDCRDTFHSEPGEPDHAGVVHRFTRAALVDDDAFELEQAGCYEQADRITARADRMRARRRV